MKPIIGITCGMSYHAKELNFINLPHQFHQLSDTYVRAVERAGGIPLIIPAYSDPELALDMIQQVDGILFSGGGDVDPLILNSRALSTVSPIQPRRDSMELKLAKYAIEQMNVPVMGVCRGIQVVNIAMGGTVYIDLEAEGKLEHRMSMYPYYMASHKVELCEGTRLANIMGTTHIETNSYHHQAVKELADCFSVAALSVPDGVIEAAEKPGDRFVVLVQWHPEAMENHKEHQAIFRSFISEAAKYKAGQR